MFQKHWAGRALLLLIGLCSLLLNACNSPTPVEPAPLALATPRPQPSAAPSPGATASAASNATPEASSEAGALVYMWPTALPNGLVVSPDQSTADETAFELTLLDPTNAQNQVFIRGGLSTREAPQLSSRPITVRGQAGVAATTGAGYAVAWKERGQAYTVGGFMLSAEAAAAIAEMLEPLTLAAWRDRLATAAFGDASAAPGATAEPVRCLGELELKGEVSVAFDPFCVIWADTFDGERGFRIDLTYGGGEQFSYLASPDATQFGLPPEVAPRTSESRELCQRRGSFSVSVTALLGDGEALVGGLGLDSECMMGFPPESSAEEPLRPVAPAPIDPRFAALRDDLAQRIAAWDGQHALSVTDLQSGQTISVNGERPQLAACTIKLGIMLAVAEDIEAGRLTADEVAELVQAAMGPSHTWPARELLRLVGDGDIGAGVHRVNAIFSSLGVSASLLTHPPGYPDEEYGYLASHGSDENLLTTDDLNLVLGKLSRGEALPPSATKYVLQAMTIAPDWMDQPLRASLPVGAKVYHKIGQLPEPEQVWNDAAMVEVERGGQRIAYVISYLGSYDASWQTAYTHETELAAAVWAYFDAAYPAGR